MSRNRESWWRAQYSQDGEVGKQAEMPDEEWTLWQSVKFTFTGIEPPKRILGKVATD